MMLASLVGIRPVRVADSESLYPLIAGTPVTDAIVWEGPTSLEQYRETLRRREREFLAGTGHTFTIVERATDRPVGTVVLRVEEPPGWASVGIWLGQIGQGRGYGTEAVGLIVRYGFEQLGLQCIEAQILVGNVASRRAFEKNGFVLDRTQRGSVVKRGRLRDEWVLLLRRTESK